MSELLVIDKTVLVSIADSIRAITKKADAIPVTNLASEVAELAGSGSIGSGSITELIDRSITEIVVPKSVKTIGAGAFMGCSNCLSYDFTAFETYEEIPTLANENAFEGINANAKIYVRGELYNMWKRKGQWPLVAKYFSPVGEVPPDSASAGLNVEYNDDETALVITGRGGCADTVITVPDTFLYYSTLMQFEKIGEQAFNSDTTVIELILPAYGVKVESEAFENCTALKKVENLKKGGYYAFYKCTALESVTFTDGVTFELGAFSGCSKCKLYDFSRCTSVPYLKYTGNIMVSSGTKIVVPDALYDSWIVATNWSSFASYIVKASEA